MRVNDEKEEDYGGNGSVSKRKVEKHRSCDEENQGAEQNFN